MKTLKKLESAREIDMWNKFAKVLNSETYSALNTHKPTIACVLLFLSIIILGLSSCITDSRRSYGLR